jgi:hypothetical protein
VDEVGFRVLKLLGDVPSQTEVRILIDGARDEAGDVRLLAEDLREGVRERWRCLYSSKVDFPDVIAVTA